MLGIQKSIHRCESKSHKESFPGDIIKKNRVSGLYFIALARSVESKLLLFVCVCVFFILHRGGGVREFLSLSLSLKVNGGGI